MGNVYAVIIIAVIIFSLPFLYIILTSGGFWLLRRTIPGNSCPSCGGRGRHRLIGGICPACHGTGLVPQDDD